MRGTPWVGRIFTGGLILLGGRATDRRRAGALAPMIFRAAELSSFDGTAPRPFSDDWGD